MVLDDIFWLTIGVVFAAALIGAIVRGRRRDRCLALFAGQDATAVLGGGKAVWGDLLVYGRGLELCYPEPVAGENGATKRSYMVPGEEFDQVQMVCRWAGVLSDAERERRAAQVRRLANPSLLWRVVRYVRNLVNSIRDAFSQALTMLVGRLSAAGPKPLAAQKGRLTEVGDTLVGAAARAYEPMLERHIGRPIVAEVQNAADPASWCELRGFLADYTESYLALVSVEHPPAETFTWTPGEELARPDLRCAEEPGGRVRIDNLSAVPLVIARLVDGSGERGLGIALPFGAHARLGPFAGPVTLRLARCPQIDVCCSRKFARVRHASA